MGLIPGATSVQMVGNTYRYMVPDDAVRPDREDVTTARKELKMKKSGVAVMDDREKQIDFVRRRAASWSIRAIAERMGVPVGYVRELYEEVIKRGCDID